MVDYDPGGDFLDQFFFGGGVQVVDSSLFFFFYHRETPIDVGRDIFCGEFSVAFGFVWVTGEFEEVFFEEFKVLVQIFITQYNKWFKFEDTLLFLLNIFHDIAHLSIAVQNLLHGGFVDGKPISTLVNLWQKSLGQFVFVVVEHFFTEEIERYLCERTGVSVFDEETVQVSEHTCEYICDNFEVVPLGCQDSQ